MINYPDLIDEYFSNVLVNFYKQSESRFFSEDEVVRHLHDYLCKKKEIIGNEKARVYMEYPVISVIPLSISEKNIPIVEAKLKSEEAKKEFSEFYVQKSKKVFFEDPKEIASKYNSLLLELDGNYIESKYVDLACFNDYRIDNSLNDKEQIPNVIIEYKYEPSKNRINKDFRAQFSQGLHNSKNSLWKDLFFIETCVNKQSNTSDNLVGYFVLIDEDGKQSEVIRKILEKYQETRKCEKGIILIVKVALDEPNSKVFQYPIDVIYK